MSTVLVTGATGFIGGAVARALVAAGHDVLAPCRDPDSARAKLAGDGVRVCAAGDGFLPVEHARVGAVDAVVHLAIDYGRDNAPASRVAATNLVASLRLLEWATSGGAGLFINADTCFTPEYPYLRSYTLSKKQFVAWGEALAAEHGFRFVNLVLQHPFGPGDRPGKFVPWLIERCLGETGSIDLTAGDQQKDFIYVDDVAAACLCVLQRAADLPRAASQFEVGRGEAATVRRFIELIHAACGSAATLNFGALPKRDGEPQLSVADISPLAALGWRPRVTLDEGVRETVAAQRALEARRGLSV